MHKNLHATSRNSTHKITFVKFVISFLKSRHKLQNAESENFLVREIIELFPIIGLTRELAL